MQEPSVISSSDLALIRDFIAGKEPILARCKSGPRKSKVYSIAETSMSDHERIYLNECVDSNWISSKGPFVRRFEEQFARQAGCEFAVACANATASLQLALAALGIGAGDEVILPTFTMIATANAVRYTGATVKLVDA